MDSLIIVLVFAVGACLGAASIWFIKAQQARRTSDELIEERRRIEELRRELQDEKIGSAGARAVADQVLTVQRKLDDAGQNIIRLESENARLAAELRSHAQAHHEKVTALTSLRGGIEVELKNLAHEALKANQSSFIELAEQVFKQHHVTAAGDLEKRQEAIQSLLRPIAVTLEEYRKGLSELEKARVESYTGISSELRNVIRTNADVRQETSKLVNALRAAPKTRGRWGEQQLENVLELAGMTQHVDFTREGTFERDDGKLRPDAIIRLPGERFIVVDAKTSMAAYLDAVEAVEDAQREAHLVRHAQQMRHHMKQLAAKSYWDSLTVTPDFVAMFVPGDNLFAAAMERDLHLFEDAIACRVLIVTPTTLIALAKAVAFGWRQEKVAENARRVAELGRDLYKRMQVMGGHIVRVGTSIEATVRHYNSFVGSLEGSVMPQARKFAELELEGTQDEIKIVDPVSDHVRVLRADRDLIVPEGMPQSPALDRTA